MFNYYEETATEKIYLPLEKVIIFDTCLHNSQEKWWWNNVEITEDIIKKVISSFQTSVKEKNIIECKKFIQHYVDKVLVFSDRVEVVYRIDVSLLKGTEGYTVLSGKSIKRIKKEGRNIA